MTSKKIDNLRYEDYEGTEIIIGLCSFLETLNIKSASDVVDEANEILEDEFCGQCKVTNDDCDCPKYDDHECDYDDGDRAYDAWKDAQLENEDTKG